MRVSLAGTNLPNEPPAKRAHHSIMRSRCAVARIEPHPTRMKAPMRAKKQRRGSLHEPETPNTEHRTPNAERCGGLGGTSMFDVRRSMFSLRGSWSQCAQKKAWALPMNRLVAQAFQPAGLPDFRVRWTRNGRLESRPDPQARKPLHEPACSAGFPACGFTGLSSPVDQERATGKSPGPAGSKACATNPPRFMVPM